MANIMVKLSQLLAQSITKSHIIEGAEELIQLILLLSHNSTLFTDAINNYLISDFFSTLLGIRNTLEDLRLQ